jgi:hypothetical protein
LTSEDGSESYADIMSKNLNANDESLYTGLVFGETYKITEKFSSLDYRSPENNDITFVTKTTKNGETTESSSSEIVPKIIGDD